MLPVRAQALAGRRAAAAAALDEGIAQLLRRGAVARIRDGPQPVAGSRPPRVSSSMLPTPSGAEMVPVPIRSPASRLQPPQVWCATICATVQ